MVLTDLLRGVNPLKPVALVAYLGRQLARGLDGAVWPYQVVEVNREGARRKRFRTKEEFKDHIRFVERDIKPEYKNRPHDGKAYFYIYPDKGAAFGATNHIEEPEVPTVPPEFREIFPQLKVTEY